MVMCVPVAFALACTSAVVTYELWAYLTPDREPNPAAGAPEVPVVREVTGGEPLLSDWGFFGEYWVEAAEGGIFYREVAADGTCADYAPKLGWGEKEKVSAEYQPLLEGAEDVGSEGGWDLAVVDCSTGELSYWALAGDVRTRVEELCGGAGKGSPRGGFSAWGNGWAVYLNAPCYTGRGMVLVELIYAYNPETWVRERAASYGGSYEWLASTLDRDLDDDERDRLVRLCSDELSVSSEVTGDEVNASLRTLAAHSAGDAARKVLVDEFGEAEVERWAQQPVPSEAEGFLDYMGRGGHGSEACLALAERVAVEMGWDW